MSIINLVEMTDDEFMAYKKETLLRLCRIAEAEGHPFVAYVTTQKWGEMIDLETGVPIYTMGGKDDA